jgi:hypothetical protein
MLYQLAFPMSHLEPPPAPLVKGEQLENKYRTQPRLVLTFNLQFVIPIYEKLDT